MSLLSYETVELKPGNVGCSYGRTELATELLIPSWQQNWVEMEKSFSDDGVSRESP